MTDDNYVDAGHPSTSERQPQHDFSRAFSCNTPRQTNRCLCSPCPSSLPTSTPESHGERKQRITLAFAFQPWSRVQPPLPTRASHLKTHVLPQVSEASAARYRVCSAILTLCNLGPPRRNGHGAADGDPDAERQAVNRHAPGNDVGDA